MVAAITAFLTAVPVAIKVIAPLITLIVGWLAPSPLQKATQVPKQVGNAEKQADAGNTSSLDNL